MKLRRGMWALSSETGQVGVFNGMRGGQAEFHRVGVEGLTEIILLVDPHTLVQASYEDIPEARRPSLELAKVLGYL